MIDLVFYWNGDMLMISDLCILFFKIERNVLILRKIGIIGKLIYVLLFYIVKRFDFEFEDWFNVDIFLKVVVEYSYWWIVYCKILFMLINNYLFDFKNLIIEFLFCINVNLLWK